MALADTQLRKSRSGHHSLWGRAWVRLRRNRPAAISALFLGLMTLSCGFGPFLAPHAFDRIYQDYVRMPASLTGYPSAEQIRSTAERALSRGRVAVDQLAISGDEVSVSVRSNREIDPRIAEYLDRTDLFAHSTLTSQSADRQTGVLRADLVRITFPFGTDGNGRDLLSRTLVAGRVSLAVGLLATLVAVLIGLTYGAVAGYVGGRVDLLMMRAVDVLYALPFIFFVILLGVFFGRNFVLIFVAVGAIEWLDMARIVRGQTLSLKRQEYVQAAKALGVDRIGTIRRHIVPNLLGPVAIYVTLLVPRVILLESFLSFLGLGINEPLTSWGALIADGALNMQSAPWMLLFPSLFLTATLFALNFLGDGLRDALDPRDR